MKDLIPITNEVTMTSVEVTELINQERKFSCTPILQHCNYLKTIRKCINELRTCGLDYTKYFIESTYTDTQNKNRPCYNITSDGLMYLSHKSRTDTVAYGDIMRKLNPNYTPDIITLCPTYTRKEILIYQLLLSMFDAPLIKTQYHVLNYRVDFYIPCCRLVIEYDELTGHTDIDKDNQRMDEIVQQLSKERVEGEFYDDSDYERYNNKQYHDIIKVIRIREGEEHIGINELLNFLLPDFACYSKLKYL